jgi:hypothetical protein
VGLDNYAIYGKEHSKYNHTEGADNGIPNELFPENQLCGGMFSGGGHSFRGKVYNNLVETFTGFSLYEDILNADEVEIIANELSKVTESRFIDEFSGYDSYEITYHEVKQLAEWFRVVANEGGSVISWY